MGTPSPSPSSSPTPSPEVEAAVVLAHPAVVAVVDTEDAREEGGRGRQGVVAPSSSHPSSCLSLWCLPRELLYCSIQPLSLAVKHPCCLRAAAQGLVGPVATVCVFFFFFFKTKMRYQYCTYRAFSKPARTVQYPHSTSSSTFVLVELRMTVQQLETVRAGTVIRR